MSDEVTPIQATVEQTGACERLVKITVSPEHLKSSVDSTYAELRQTVTLPGFRKGKAPRSMLVKRFGDHVLEDVKRDVVSEAFSQVIKEHELDVVSEPEIDVEGIELDTDAGMAFEFKVEVRPDFELGDYKTIEATRTVAAVTDEEITEALEQLAKQRSDFIPLEDEASAKDDLVLGHMILTKDGSEVYNREDAGMIAGTEDKIVQVPIPEDRDNFVGLKVGDELDWDTELPETHYIQDLRGSDVHASFKVLEVKRIDIPELDDEIAGQYGFDSLAEFEAKVREDMEHRNVHEADAKVEEAVIDELIERTPFDLPESLVNRSLERQVQQRLYQEMVGGNMPDDLPARKVEVETEEREKVQRSVRAWYLIEKIAEREKIFATEDDVQERIEQIAMQQGKTPTQILEEFEKEDVIGRVRSDILETKVRKFLTDAAQIVEVGNADSEESEVESA